MHCSYMKTCMTIAILVASMCGIAQMRKKPVEWGKPLPAVLDSVIGKRENKPLVLEFFSSTCAVCFSNLPKMNALQEEFGGKLKFILIGKEDGKIRALYEKFRKKFDLSLEVRYDSLLFRSIHIPAFPQYVWVDANGMVRGVTGVKELTPSNIRTFLQTNTVKVREGSPVIPFNGMEPLLVNGNGGPDSVFSYRSIFSEWTRHQVHYLPREFDFSKKPLSFQVLGASMAELYNYAYWGVARWYPDHQMYGRYYPVPFFEDSSLELCSPDTSKYCYSLRLSPRQNRFTTIQETMKADLERFFGYIARAEVQYLPCLKLCVWKDAVPALKPTGSKYVNRQDHAGFTLDNARMKQLVEAVYAKYRGPLPIVDETGITEPIGISVEVMAGDFNALRRALNQSGLDLVPSYSRMNVIVLRPIKGNIAGRDDRNISRMTPVSD